MLSHVRRRLFHQSLLGGNISVTLRPAVAQYSSKKNDKDGPDFSAGLSEPVKKQDRKITHSTRQDGPSTVPKELFDEIIQATSLKPRKAAFKRKDETEKSKKHMKNMKPGQLNIKMVEAAKTVASHAGASKDTVLEDLLGKLDDVFEGMDHHVKQDKRKGDRKHDLKTKLDRAVPKWSSAADLQAKERSFEQETLDSSMTSHSDIDEISIISKAYSLGSSPKRPSLRFNSLEELLKSRSPEGIFNMSSVVASDPQLKMWSLFEEKEMMRVTKFDPLNWFDQCIVWTEEGKLWKFPIDNEQGMDQEAEVDFTEHIFLDHHIESWCPKEGPIRHFMELVLVGLSKNPFMTVSAKKETIEWYHQYFVTNQSLLEEINAFGSVQNPIPVEGEMN